MGSGYVAAGTNRTIAKTGTDRTIAKDEREQRYNIQDEDKVQDWKYRFTEWWIDLLERHAITSFENANKYEGNIIREFINKINVLDDFDIRYRIPGNRKLLFIKKE